MPVAIIDPGTPADTYYMTTDHIGRPIILTDASKSVVADVIWSPFGGVINYSGSVDLDLRFPGQLFQGESGLHYNWFRQYDPTTARYTQPDPAGLVDGPSRYAYVANDPLQRIDPLGLQLIIIQQHGLRHWGWQYRPRVLSTIRQCVGLFGPFVPGTNFAGQANDVHYRGFVLSNGTISIGTTFPN
ncbi:RHS repeat-associated core domain-containing protein [uncultured Devosia sp.]|uniref:RHS repeat-associated core domain-containing protein n=1 Tax=uncultured Devosia sp. TaxID=211434 RepID=UPI0035CC2251